jgi:hypothetical protein
VDGAVEGGNGEREGEEACGEGGVGSGVRHG